MPVEEAMLSAKQRAADWASGGKPGNEGISGAHEKAGRAEAIPHPVRDRGVSAPVDESGKKVETLLGAGRSEGGNGSDLGGVSVQPGPVDAGASGGRGSCLKRRVRTRQGAIKAPKTANPKQKR